MECKKTVRKYWEENGLEQALIFEIEKEALSCFDGRFARGRIEPEIFVCVAEKNSLFGRSAFCVKAEITGEYVMEKPLYDYMDYKTDKADAYGAMQVVNAELAEINARKEMLLQSVNRAASVFVREKLSCIVFSDARTLQVFANVNFEVGALKSILKTCKTILK